ncbi:MAG: carboxypeptidase regulatory-like domain-containing protein [Bryobacter sp.]|nr:carboxypeptidase regulatory-like domain-containing protein [Bryobacter sp.]
MTLTLAYRILRKLQFSSLLLCFSLLGGLSAQTTTSTLLGDISDPNNAAIQAATVTLKNLATGVAQDTTTDNQGTYRFFAIAPGTYEVKATASGFQTALRSKVVVEAAAQVKADFRLALAGVSETVTVEDRAPLLQTQDGSVGGIVTATELQRLPVNGRNYTRLIQLMPGTSNRGSSQSQGTFSGTSLTSVNGQRQQDNNFTLDGVDNNFLFQNSPGASPPMDSIAEFRVLSNTSAEFGRSAGANVSIVTRSGSRDLHGSLYEFLRNDKLDAADFFANRSGVGKLPFRQNQYGLALGGPVVLPKLYRGRDKTFWFFNWEGFRQRQSNPRISTVPTLAQRQGDFNDLNRNIYDPFSGTTSSTGGILRTPFPNRIVPASQFNRAGALFLNEVVPEPSFTGTANNLINTSPVSNDRDVWIARGDHTFSSRDNVTFRYLRQKVGFVTPTNFPTVNSQARFDAHNLGINWNHIFGPNAVLETRFGYNNPTIPIEDVNSEFSRSAFIQRSGLQMFQENIPGGALPALNATGIYSYPVGTGGGGRITDDKIFQPSATLTLVQGRHTIKAGFMLQVRHFQQDAGDPMNGVAVFDTRLTSLASVSNSGSSVASLLLGTPSSIQRGAGNVLIDARSPLQAYFVQDDYRVTRRLTLNLGLRYEYNTPAYALDDGLGTLDVAWDPATNIFTPVLLWAGQNQFTNQGPNRGDFGRALQSPDRNDFAPRFGFAYQASSKTVVRGAFGMFYNSSFFQELLDKRKFYPVIPQQNITTNTGARPDILITDPGPAYSTNIGGWAQSPHKRTPYSMQWNLTIQRELARDLSWDLGYVGSGNRHQIGYTTFNQALTPGPGSVNPRRRLPTIGNIQGGINEFNSSYHSFRTSLVKRFSAGLQFNANYTWSKLMTGQASLSQNIIQDQYNRRADYSRADFDIPHVFQIAYVYDLPFGRGRRFGSSWSRWADGFLGGWSLEGITRIQNGSPVNATSGVDRANVGASVQRPNVWRNPNTGGSRNVSERWFDTSAFELPAIYTFGNAGANILISDGRHNWDLAIAKSWQIREGHALQFRTEAFNSANHVNFGNPNANFSSTAFGLVDSATSARQLQFALRYSF